MADIEFDPACGKICQLIIPGPGKLCGLFGRESECVIGWNCVRQIGTDIILVDVDGEMAQRRCGEGSAKTVDHFRGIVYNTYVNNTRRKSRRSGCIDNDKCE